MIPQLSIPELLARLNEFDESSIIEAKRSQSEVGKSTLETISAFSNEPGQGGGYLLFGVSEGPNRTFTASGVVDPKKIEQDLASQCASTFNRVLRPRIWTEIVNGASVVGAFIPEAAAPEKPIFIKSRGMQTGAFRRIGSGDQCCTEDDLRVLFQASSLTPYEDTIVSDSTTDDLDREVIGRYRNALVEANPATELRDATLEALVQALGGARNVGGILSPTVAGVLLFGKPLSLRRLFPAVRVDYVRIPGTEWVPDPDRRYESIEVREPLLLAFRRIYNAIVDDLPKSFALESGTPERRDQLAIPESAIREALVNALTHRDYRIANPVLIIRYQDRIEIRNPGYSLVDDDQLGQPGSFPRNPRIADVFREMRLAENKGTGVAAIRKAMKRAGLTPPIFDSDRARNQFVAALWLHNLIGADDTDWLQNFSAHRLSDAQARALVVAKRAGSISNAMLRDISGLDTLAASNELRQLRDLGLLEPQGKGSATHYVLGVKARAAAEPKPKTGELDRQTGGFEPQTGGFGQQTGGFGQQTGEFEPQTGGFGQQTGGFGKETEAAVRRLPPAIRVSISELGSRPTEALLRGVIVQICSTGWWTASSLAEVLGRKDHAHLSVNHLTPMVTSGELERRYPDNLAHPKQAYRTRQSVLPLIVTVSSDKKR
jgi:ATP-dependent DNA helicase RecG